MTGLEKMKSQILDEAKAVADSKIAEAKAQAEEIMSQAKAEAEKKQKKGASAPEGQHLPEIRSGNSKLQRAGSVFDRFAEKDQGPCCKAGCNKGSPE